MNARNQGPAFPRTRKYKYDGVGGYAPNSGPIPIVEAALWVGGTVFAVWATVKIAFWIWG